MPEYFLRKTCVTCSSSAVLFMNLNLDHVRLHETENVSVTQLHIQPGVFHVVDLLRLCLFHQFLIFVLLLLLSSYIVKLICCSSVLSVFVVNISDCIVL